MNEISEITIDAEGQTGGALATIGTTDLAAVFAAPGALDVLIERIKVDARARAAKLDISTEKGRKGIASLAKTYVAGAKMQIVNAANQLTEGWREQTAAVVADRKKAETELNALRDEIEAQLVAYREAEKARTKANETAIGALEALVNGLTDLLPAEIKERHRQAGIVAEFEWSPEFIARAERVQNGVIAQLEVAYTRAVQREAEAAAEVVRLAEEAERQRLAAIEAQRLREEQIAREAADAARVAAEAKAVREAEEARQAAQAERDAAAARERCAAEALQRAETARIEAEQRAERERVEAIERERIAAERAEINRKAEAAKAEHEKVEAVEAERQRAAKEAADAQAAADARAANQKHRGGIMRAAKEALMQHAEIDEETAKRVVLAISRDQVPAVSVRF